MDRSIRRVLIIANLQKDGAAGIVEDIRTYAEGRGIEVESFTFRGKPGPPPEGRHDLAFSLGGDGTVLFAARVLARIGTPILPVNLGAFGFITEVGRAEWKEAFEAYEQGVLGTGPRSLLRVCVRRNGHEIANIAGLNDAVVSATGLAKIIQLSVTLDETPVGRYRADGMIVATPTGSTAYSAAAGGPILFPEMEAMIINPICPFTLSHRPIVVPGSETIYIDVDPDQRTGALLTVDGQVVLPLEEGDRICVRQAEYKALIIRSNLRNFYEVLRSKLNWSGGSHA